MFHEGSLQSGIALAIQESKLVACFVRGETISASGCGAELIPWSDEGAASKQWEEEWLKSGWVGTNFSTSDRKADISSFQVS